MVKTNICMEVQWPSALNSGLSPGWGHNLCSLARHLSLTVPLSTKVYKGEPAYVFDIKGNPAID